MIQWFLISLSVLVETGLVIAHILKKVFALITFNNVWLKRLLRKRLTSKAFYSVRNLLICYLKHFLFQTCNVTMAKFHGLELKILFIYIVCAFLSCEERCFVYCLRLESFQKDVWDKNRMCVKKKKPMWSFRKFLPFSHILNKTVPCLLK